MIEMPTAIWITVQERRRPQTRGIKMPNGENSTTLPLALRRQNARAGEPSARVAEVQVSDVRFGWRSIPIAASAARRELWLGMRVAAARPERYTTKVRSRISRGNER